MENMSSIKLTYYVSFTINGVKAADQTCPSSSVQV